MILRLEELAMNAWPSLVTTLYKGCVIRSSNGYTKRANSANPIYNDMNNIDSMINFVEMKYKDMNLPVVFKILDIDKYKVLNECLSIRQYEKLDLTNVMTIDFKKYTGVNNVIVNIENEFSKKWLESFMKINHVGINENTAREMLFNIIGKKYVASICINNKIVACGYGAVEDSFIGFFDIVVDEKNRGKGYGKALMNGIIKKAIKENIETGYLQVVSNNKIAKTMYSSLGFEEKYEYWYMKKK